VFPVPRRETVFDAFEASVAVFPECGADRELVLRSSGPKSRAPQVSGYQM